MKRMYRLRRVRDSRRSSYRRLTLEKLEGRELLATTQVVPSFKSLTLFGSGTFSGAGPGDIFSGVASFSGEITYTSATLGTGSGSGQGNGTGIDVCSGYAFLFSGTAQIVDVGGDISHSSPTDSSFDYTILPSCNGIGGSLYQTDFLGTFSTADFSATLSASGFGYRATWSGSISFGGGDVNARIASAEFTAQGFEYSFAVDGKPIQAETHLTPVSKVAAYWSSGNDKLAALHEPIDVYWNQSGGLVTVREIGAIPEGATGFLVEIDGDLQLAESSREDNSRFVELPRLVAVNAAYDDLDDEELELGGFLPGVKLPQKLALDYANVDPESIVSIKIESPATGEIALEFAEGAWRTVEDVDMGLFEEDTTVTVTTVVGGDFEFVDTFEVKMAEKFDLEVFAKSGNTTAPIEHIRLIEGIQLPSILVDIPLADIELPLSADGNPYRSRLDVVAITAGEETSFRPSLFANDAQLQQFLNGVPVGDSKLVVKARESFRTKDIELSNQESLLKISLPAWMGTPAEKSYDASGGNYEISLSAPSYLQQVLPETLTSISFFLGLESHAGAGAAITIVAPLIAPDGTSAGVEFKSLFANATLLGRQLLSESVTAAQLGVDTSGSTLEGRHLESGRVMITQANPSGIEISQFQSSSGKLFDVAFGNTPQTNYSQNLSSSSIQQIKKLTDIDFTPSLSFSGGFSSHLSSARLRYSLAFDAATGLLDPSATFLAVGASGAATASLSVGAGIDVLGFDFLSATATATLGAVANVNAHLAFGGGLLSPSVVSFGINGAVTLSATFGYNVRVLDEDYVSDTIPLGSTTYNLFSMDFVPPQRQFDDGAAVESLQRARFVQGLAGVAPTEGGAFALLGDITGQDVGTAHIRFAQPVAGNVAALKHDLRILADHAELEPETHFLEVAMTGSGEVVRRIDLSTFPLIAQANDLGFGSDWTEIDGLALTPLDAAQEYQLEFRLVTPSGGANVLLALDNLQIEVPPTVAISSPNGAMRNGDLRFAGADSVAVALTNTRGHQATVYRIELVGDGFELPLPLSEPHVLYVEDAPTVFDVRVLNSAATASAILRIETDDPDHPIREITITYFSSASAGDYNLDGLVDSDDYHAWRAAFGYIGHHVADGNGDGFVDAADYTIWRDQLASAGAAARASAIEQSQLESIEVKGDSVATTGDNAADRVFHAIDRSAGASRRWGGMWTMSALQPSERRPMAVKNWGQNAINSRRQLNDLALAEFSRFSSTTTREQHFHEEPFNDAEGSPRRPFEVETDRFFTDLHEALDRNSAMQRS